MPATPLTPAAQDYLKVVWTAREWSDRPVTVTTLAQRLELAPSTVSEAVRKLTDAGLLTHAPYGSIDLTERGRAAALAMVRRHRLVETFLVEYLGYDWSEVHDEAEVLEHAVSDLFVERLDARLGRPVRDPHGDPIPSADGSVPSLVAVRLTEVPAGSTVRVARVSDADPGALDRLRAIGIGLDTEVVVRSAGPDVGVEVGGRAVLVEHALAAGVWVLES